MLGRERPVALVLDDLHWADEASVEFVLHVLRRPLRCGMSARVRPAPGRTGRADAGGRARDARLDAPLPWPAAGSCGARAPGRSCRTPGSAARPARGGRSIPCSCASLRVPRAPATPACRRAWRRACSATWRCSSRRRARCSQGAAVAGDPFDPELAAAAAGVPPDAATVDRLVAAELVRATGDGRAFAFRHPLVRLAVYEAAPPAWRLDAHERAAVALERRGAARRRARASRRPVRTSRRRARGRAARALPPPRPPRPRPPRPRSWYAAALRLLPADDARHRAEVLAPLAPALVNASRLEDGRAALAGAPRTARALQPAQRLELVGECARVEVQLGRHAQARRRLLQPHGTGASSRARRRSLFELAADAMSPRAQRGARRLGELAGRTAGADDPVLIAWGADAGHARLDLERGAAAPRLARLRGRALDELDDRALFPSFDVLVQIGRAQIRLRALPRRVRHGDPCARGVPRTAARAAVAFSLRAVRAFALVQLLDLDTRARRGRGGGGERAPAARAAPVAARPLQSHARAPPSRRVPRGLRSRALMRSSGSRGAPALRLHRACSPA